MANEIQTIKIGGVEYDKNEVANQTSITKERTNSKGIWEQYKEYSVSLKDGTKLTYQEQTEDRKASIDIMDDGSVNFFGLKGAEIKGTDKNDNYRLHGCENTKTNIYGDSKNSQIGLMLGAEFKQDKAECFNRELPNGDLQESNDNIVYTDDADKTSGFRYRHTN